jgi:predicted Na+-dependent transporter
MSGDREKLKEVLRKFGHLISGLVIILKGYTKFEEHHAEIGIPLILLGLLFASFAVFHQKISWIKEHEPWLLWLEGLALALVAYSYFSAGKQALPFVYAICAAVYFIMGGYFYRHREAH